MSFASKFLPCGDYAPDQADLNNPGTGVAENVVPRTKSTYGPMPSFAILSAVALDSAPLGAFSARDAEGNPGLYAGTSSKLYHAINSTKPNFADASGSPYTTEEGGGWSFTEGDGKVYASNGTNPIQSVVAASTAAFADIADSNAPVAKVIAAIQPGFLLCGDIDDVTVGIQPQGVRWSALGNYESFPLIGSAAAIANSSDWQEIRGPHGRLKAVAPDLSSCNAALFFEQAVFRMIYTGNEEIFDITAVEKLRGTPAPRSVVQVGQVCYFLSHDGWYSFDGTIATPIGEGRVNKTFFADCDPNFVSNVVGTADPISGLCYWTYTSVGASNGIPNRVLVYNPNLNRFSLITGFAGNCVFLARSFGTSLDQIDALGYNLDTLPYSLDSPLLAGGRLVLGAFDANNKFGSFTGPNMAFQIDTSETQLLPGRRARVNAVRPLTQGGVCSAQVASRATLADPVVFSAANVANSVGLCMARSDGRYQRVRLSGPAGHTVQHVQGAEVQFTPSGAR